MTENPNVRMGKIVLVHCAVEGRIPHPIYDSDTIGIIDRMLDEESMEEAIENYPLG